jgi:hypothetical protein
MGRPRDIKDDILSLYEEGKTYAEIQSILGCSKSTISYHVGKGNENSRVKSNGYRKKIKEFINNYKSANPCRDCGHTYAYYVMQFDHLPQYVKLFTIAKFYEYTHDINVVIAEIKKCDLVCGNCHTERGHKRRQDKAKVKQTVKELLENGLE